MKLTQASVLGLLGATSAWTQAPRTLADISTGSKQKWPMYSTMDAHPTQAGSTPATKFSITDVTYVDSSAPTAKSTNGQDLGLMTTAYASQPYACFRNGYYYFPTQTITAGKAVIDCPSAGAGAVGTYTPDAVSATNAQFRSFWQTYAGTNGMLGTDTSADSAKILRGARILTAGADLATATGAAYASSTETKGELTKTNVATSPANAGNASYGTGASGASWACCVSVYSQFDCNGGIDTNPKTVTSLLIPHRLIIWKGSGVFNADATTQYGCPTTADTTNKMAPAVTCATNAAAKYSDYSGVNQPRIPNFNNDFMLMAMYQETIVDISTHTRGCPEATRATTDAPQYCDYMVTKFASATAAKRTASTHGHTDADKKFNGYTKCTYQFLVEGGLGAPTLKFETVDFRDFIVHWMEWSGASGDIPTGMQFKADATDNSALFMGAYGSMTASSATANGQMADTHFWNPFESSNGSDWPQTSNKPLMDVTYKTMFKQYKDTATWIPGSVGQVYWVPNKTGLQSDVQYTTMDSALLAELQNVSKAANSAFDGLKGTYDGERGTYDTAVKDEKARLADFFKAGFDAPIKVPARPCPPSRPAAYGGPQLRKAKLGTTAGITTSNFEYVEAQSGAYWQLPSTSSAKTPAAVATAISEDNSAVWPYHEFWVNAHATIKVDVEVTKMANRLGYMSASYDSSVSTAITSGEFAGRVYGRLGEGDATLPGASAPWVWKKPATTDKPGMQVSLFPQTFSATGLATTKVINVDVTPKEWGSESEFAAPAQPGAPANPADAIAAAHLAATAAAAAALALATLY